MTPRRSTARSRDIGLEPLAIREKAGFDGLGLAHRLGWDQSKVSRIEGGKQAVDEVDLISWLTSCGIKHPRIRQLVDENREATKETWVLPHGPASSDSRNLSAEEKAAKTITIYSCGLVPGLLQTPRVRACRDTPLVARGEGDHAGGGGSHGQAGGSARREGS
jgi:hypothetical protein